jgi:1-acyl-sn-glycerol-3-phosphate acyltransferase
MKKFPPQSPRGFWYRFIEFILRPLLKAATARDWRGGEYIRNVEGTGKQAGQVTGQGNPTGIVVAMNHLSWYDPLVAAHFVNDTGRPVRFMAKVEIFKIPVSFLYNLYVKNFAYSLSFLSFSSLLFHSI